MKKFFKNLKTKQIVNGSAALIITGLGLFGVIDGEVRAKITDLAVEAINIIWSLGSLF